MRTRTSKKKYEKKIQNAGIPIYKNPTFAMVVVLLASVCDFMTIYSVSEYYLSERIIINIIVTTAVAFILNFIPSLLGQAVKNKNIQNRRLLIVVLSIAFTLLFAMTFTLRWTSRGIMFDDVSTLSLSSTNAINTTESLASGTSPAEDTLAILIGSSTLFTSLLSFTFSLLALTKEEMKSRMRKIRIVELDEEIDTLKNHIQELTHVIEDNNVQRLDDLDYASAKKMLESDAACLREYVKLNLATLLQSARGTSLIMNGDKQYI